MSKAIAGSVFWLCVTALVVTWMVIQHIENKQCLERGGTIDRNIVFQDDCIPGKR